MTQKEQVYVSGARNGASLGLFLGALAFVVSVLARTFIPEVQRATIAASTGTLAMLYFLGGPFLGAVAGGLGAFGKGRLARIMIGIVVTALGYPMCAAIIDRGLLQWNGRSLFVFLFVSILLGTILGALDERN